MTELPNCKDCKKHGIPNHIETHKAPEKDQMKGNGDIYVKIYVCTGCRKFFRLYEKRTHLKTETGTKDPFREW